MHDATSSPAVSCSQQEALEPQSYKIQLLGLYVKVQATTLSFSAFHLSVYCIAEAISLPLYGEIPIVSR